MAPTIIVVARLSEPYWECAKIYAVVDHCSHIVLNELRSPDNLYDGAATDMKHFQPFRYKAYIKIKKETRRNNHKE